MAPRRLLVLAFPSWWEDAFELAEISRAKEVPLHVVPVWFAHHNCEPSLEAGVALTAGVFPPHRQALFEPRDAPDAQVVLGCLTPLVA